MGNPLPHDWIVNGKPEVLPPLNSRSTVGWNQVRVEVAELFGISDCCCDGQGWDLVTRLLPGVGAKELRIPC
jgi:hypothetical protein